MTYSQKENSVSEGAPIEIFKFEGTYRDYLYTNCDRDITFMGETYKAIAIRRDTAVIGDQSQDGQEMTIEMPQTEMIVVDYVFGIAPPDLNLTIYRCHQGLDFDTNAIIFWKGVVTGFNVEGDIAKARVPSILENVFSGNLPNYFYQQSCNHTLYDTRCGIDQALFSSTAVVTAIDGQEITVGSDGFDDGFLVGGIISIPGKNESRMILANSGEVLRVFFPFSNLSVGDTVNLSAGCDHSIATCRSKFNNGRRFGGFPYVPKDNPFEGTIT